MPTHIGELLKTRSHQRANRYSKPRRNLVILKQSGDESNLRRIFKQQTKFNPNAIKSLELEDFKNTLRRRRERVSRSRSKHSHLQEIECSNTLFSRSPLLSPKSHMHSVKKDNTIDN